MEPAFTRALHSLSWLVISTILDFASFFVRIGNGPSGRFASWTRRSSVALSDKAMSSLFSSSSWENVAMRSRSSFVVLIPAHRSPLFSTEALPEFSAPADFVVVFFFSASMVTTSRLFSSTLSTSPLSASMLLCVVHRPPSAIPLSLLAVRGVLPHSLYYVQAFCSLFKPSSSAFNFSLRFRISDAWLFRFGSWPRAAVFGS